jgi:hypothetical protein
MLSAAAASSTEASMGLPVLGSFAYWFFTAVAVAVLFNEKLPEGEPPPVDTVPEG